MLVPVTDSDLRGHLREVVLETLIADNTRAWLLTPGGRYERPALPDGVPALDAQKALLEHYAAERARDEVAV